MELLKRFADGDLEAFEALFRQFQGEVYGWIVRIVRDPGAAEDLTLETFWRIYRARARFDPARKFGAWARRVASNVALSHLKTARRLVPLFGQNGDSQPFPKAGNGGCPRFATGAAPPDPAVRDAIRCAFRRLPAKLLAVATLALLEERPYAEVADALSISVAAVKSREFRAVRILRKELQRLGVEP